MRECEASTLFMCSFMGTTPAAKTRSFCLLFVLHTAQVLGVDWREGAVGRIGERLVSPTNEDSKISFLSTTESVGCAS